MAAGSEIRLSGSDTEIVLSRVFDAPRELVWRVWTDPAHLARWWGPNGFTTTTHAMDVKPGGSWRYVMHGPDGRDYQNQINFIEVTAPERLVYKHAGGKDTEPVNFQVTVSFEKDGTNGERTRLTMRSVFPTKAAKDFVVREYNAEEGGKQHLGRLAEYLRMQQEHAPSTGPFVLSRVFRAPRQLVFDAWTKPEHLAKWFGPKGTIISKCEMDLRPGGVFHYAMRTPDGKEMWGKWTIREVVPNERLVCVVSFSDQNKGVTRHPLAATWPLETLSVVTFADHAGIGGGTVVTLQWSAINATEAERTTFDASHESMRAGWGGTMEQLDAYLAGAGGGA